MGPAHLSRFRGRALLRSVTVCGGLRHGIGRGDVFVFWAFECSHADSEGVWPATGWEIVQHYLSQQT